ncbi:MAG: hypothetical protein LRS43_01685 [Desulfurococcales archaeon]|nr:hypothetical protein [Desulfurococcales archaeon]
MAAPSPRGIAQSLAIASGLALYPYILLVEGSALAAPIVSGLLLALAPIVGTRYICPVKWGVLPGILAITVVSLTEPGYVASLASKPLALAYFTLYHLATPAAVGGAALLAYWNASRLVHDRRIQPV